MDGNNNVRGYSDRDLTRRVELGSLFFTQGNYADAASCFRDARDAQLGFLFLTTQLLICLSIQIHGESSLECAITSYSHGLSLRCQVRVPVNDPMAFVPKEVDYYEGSVLPFPSKAFGTYRGVMEENYVRILEVAKGELNLAWSLMEYRIDNYLLKGNVLSALGEVAFRRGESNPQRYYFEASSIFDTWLGEYSKRGADMYPFPVWCIISLTITLCVTVSIYLKCPACVLIDHILASESRYVELLICLEGSDESKALAHGCKAYLIYDALHKKLLSEIDSVSKSEKRIKFCNTNGSLYSAKERCSQPDA
ncbi:hypothetical protein NC653_000459 [Populus alba x Populus x berolinensis]|uniref:Uncharacterized protein n=1 Tax=Populus alba x Populus x berolinensis TaxID=444605 RepID=A0AAD6RJ05_9ROSI|nr:hypothetical protein NC653_000459 [Populus alba x Populus x berolinensis]